MASGPHLVFHPTPFTLHRVLDRLKRNRKKEEGVINPILVGTWFHDLLSALVHCHTNHVLLRSLQPDQITIDHSGVAKLAGFYRSTVLPGRERNMYVDPYTAAKHGKKTSKEKSKEKRRAEDKNKRREEGDESSVKSNCIAPEILLGSTKHTKESDIWSVGCLMANLLLGKPLFQLKTDDCSPTTFLQSIFKIVGSPSSKNFPQGKKFPNFDHSKKYSKKYPRNVKSAFVSMMSAEDHAKHKQAIDLVSSMLHLDPKLRITAVDALKHEFMQTYTEKCSSKSFREEYVAGWMSMKKDLVYSDDKKEDELRDAKDRKRKAMLETASKGGGGDAEMDDLYDMDDLIDGAERKKRKTG